ncbi:MAG TPA: hypothetical protein DCZ94_08600 [Lentisphaeria bacterium]|nr:MAG: hypothetical protein A2X48_12370 [Lentisphaerae bacterium GWF2_49_21]HBC86998.1 hypothetical protein [Lentisphaeria bacterium]
MTKLTPFLFFLFAGLSCLADINIGSDSLKRIDVVDSGSFLPKEADDAARSLADFAVGYLTFLEQEKLSPAAKDYFIKSVQKNPEARLPIALLVREWFTNQAFQECIDNFRPIASENPGAIELNLSVASAMICLKKDAEAASLLEKTFRTLEFPITDKEKKKSCLNLVTCLADIYGKSKMFDEGESLFDNILGHTEFSEDFKTRRSAAVFFSLRADQGEDGFFSGWTKRRFRKKMDQNLEACETLWYSMINPEDKKAKTPSILELVPILELNKRYKLYEGSERIILNSLISLTGNEYLYRILGAVYSDWGRYGTAYRIWKMLAQKNNSEPYYYYELGHSSLMMKNFTEASKSFEWLLLLKPDYNPIALYQLGICYYELKKYDKALNKLGKITDMPEAKYLAALCYRQQAEYKKAVKTLEEAEKIALEQKRDDYLTNDFYLTFAAFCDKAGMFEKTVEILKKEVEKNPEDPETVNFLGYLLADKNKDLDYAEKLIRIAVDAENQNPAFLDSLAWVFYRKGDIQSAKKYIEKSLKAQEDSPDGVISDHAGDIYNALGDRTAALKYWKIAEETWNPDVNVDTVREKIRKAEDVKF